MVRGYWLQIGKEYINDLFIKKLRRIQGNNNLPFIYAKILYLSIENGGEGIIEFEHVEETFEMELAMALDEKEEEVNVVIKNALASGKIEQDGDLFYFPDAHKYTNLKSADAQRMEKSRKKKEDGQTDSKAKKKPKKNVDQAVMQMSEEVISYLNQKIGTRYKPDTVATLKLIKARMNEGFTLEDFKAVIDMKADEWVLHPDPNSKRDMSAYATPNTLFSGKMEGYRESARLWKSKHRTLEDFYAEPEKLPPEEQGYFPDWDEM